MFYLRLLNLIPTLEGICNIKYSLLIPIKIDCSHLGTSIIRVAFITIFTSTHGSMKSSCTQSMSTTNWNNFDQNIFSIANFLQFVEQALTHRKSGEQYWCWAQSSWMRHSSGNRSGVSTSTWLATLSAGLLNDTRGISWTGLTPSWSLRSLLTSSSKALELLLSGVPPTGIALTGAGSSWSNIEIIITLHSSYSNHNFQPSGRAVTISLSGENDSAGCLRGV